MNDSTTRMKNEQNFQVYHIGVNVKIDNMEF
jgi:hypothetical protein